MLCTPLKELIFGVDICGKLEVAPLGLPGNLQALTTC
jgi:hypothetical protein